MATVAAKNAAPMDRSQVEKFLQTCIDLFNSDATRETLKEADGRPGAKIVELQKQVFEDLGIVPEVGRATMARLEEHFPEDHAALTGLKEEFGKSMDAAYLQCLEDRRPASLKKKGKMPRGTVLEFLEASSVKLDLPEVRERLRKHVQETGTMPEPVVNEVHEEVMELLGFDRRHGLSCFQEMGGSSEFTKDQDIAVSYARWRGKTRRVCLQILRAHQEDGGELNVDLEVKGKLIELRAKEELDVMTIDQRVELLNRNAKKVNVLRGLPSEARQQYLAKLQEGEKLEIAKSEILMMTLAQSQHQKQGYPAQAE
eukprot:TRINITY_DN6760_c2_g1_i1.p1 TRINITY_DN6760_c2_g1~~TRINITY_DN6760_c2_g1_i1.p1  ORF type:complete len:334 (-),score=80.14 TRINITY_DN6760_c2_g1_i1:59-997(-)